MNNISQSTHKINELYEGLSYFDQYGGSVIIFIILILILFCIVSYFSTIKNIQPIKDDWVNQRCKPQVIPFAGLINKPENMSVSEFTGQNFTQCVQNILTNITGFAVLPITYMTSTLQELFSVFASTLDAIRALISSIQSNMTSITQEIMGRIANIMVPIQQILIAFSDTMEKVKGILVAGLYTSLSTYYALRALFNAIMQFIVTILIILAALIVVMWIIPFTWPAAGAMTAIFISIAIPMAILMVFMHDVLNIDIESPIPDVPSSSCFDKNTLIKMNNSSYKKIIDVCIGDVLENNNIVTAKMKLCAKNETMYNINGTIVSSTHQVKYNNTWIYVGNHPDRTIVKNYKEQYLYCLNTSSKIIKINNILYLDWDELQDIDIIKLLTYDGVKCIDDIHKNFDTGFKKNTKIKLFNGMFKSIIDINVGDVLDKNIIVTGIVEINGNDLLEKEKEKEKEKGKEKEKDLKKNNLGKDLILYHLITDKGVFYINNIKFNHYNSIIEILLDKW